MTIVHFCGHHDVIYHEECLVSVHTITKALFDLEAAEAILKRVLKQHPKNTTAMDMLAEARSRLVDVVNDYILN